VIEEWKYRPCDADAVFARQCTNVMAKPRGAASTDSGAKPLLQGRRSLPYSRATSHRLRAAACMTVELGLYDRVSPGVPPSARSLDGPAAHRTGRRMWGVAHQARSKTPAPPHLLWLERQAQRAFKFRPTDACIPQKRGTGQRSRLYHCSTSPPPGSAFYDVHKLGHWTLGCSGLVADKEANSIVEF